MKIRIGDKLLHLFLIVCAVLWLFPFYWALVSSFKTEQQMFQIPPIWFPLDATWFNYVDLIERTKVIQWTFNSFYVSLAATCLVCLIGCLAGYAFAKMRFRGRDIVFYMMIATMMLPKYVLLVPLFRLMKTFGWFDTYTGLIVPEAASALPFAIFLMRQFIYSIPSELFDAAKVDGCSEIGIFTRIVVSLTKPALAALAIFTFVRAWNDYMWQLIVTNSDAMKTLPLGIAGLQLENVVVYGRVMAGAMLSALPMILVFVVFQKHFTRGLTLGAVKG